MGDDRPTEELPGPEDPGLQAWRAFLTAYATVIRRLEAELEAEEDLALTDFDVLVQLHFAGGELRMRELADRVLLSRSGMTRRVDRLEAAGYVRRTTCDTDRRGFNAALTDAGRERVEQAVPVHVRGIARHFLAPLGVAELETLRVTLEKLSPPEAASG